MNPALRYPALSDLRRRARARIPHFAWEYLDSATGTESVVQLNRAGLEQVRMLPSALNGEFSPDLATNLLGQRLSAPFGIGPVGMSGLIWPGAEAALARLAARQSIPYTLSTVATRLPEEVGPLAGDHGWFQLYPPRDPEIRADLLRRARDAGFRVLVLTIDVPAPSRRERQLRADLAFPPKKTARMLLQTALHPEWAWRTLRMGVPRLRLMEEYKRLDGSAPSTGHAGYLLRVNPDWDYVAALRDGWDGPLVLKGVLRPEDARRAQSVGVDAVWISNHGGRQFDGAPASIDIVPGVRAAVGPAYPLIADGGVESGLDILRMIAMGADFVMLGRAWHYALAALGARGAAHLDGILRDDLIANMMQLGLTTPKDAGLRLWSPTRV